jgi:hypothetical protein
MWVLVLVFMGDFGGISTEQTSWFQTQEACVKAASQIDLERTVERQYSVVAECFPASGQE